MSEKFKEKYGQLIIVILGASGGMYIGLIIALLLIGEVNISITFDNSILTIAGIIITGGVVIRQIYVSRQLQRKVFEQDRKHYLEKLAYKKWTELKVIVEKLELIKSIVEKQPALNSTIVKNCTIGPKETALLSCFWPIWASIAAVGSRAISQKHKRITLSDVELKALNNILFGDHLNDIRYLYMMGKIPKHLYQIPKNED